MTRSLKRIVLPLCGWGVLFCGCERGPQTGKPAPSGKPGEQAKAVAPQASKAVAAVDVAGDHSASPTWLPKPDEISGWVRTANTKVVFAGDWDRVARFVPTDHIDAFSIKSATTTQYTSVAPNTPGMVVEFAIVEAYDGDDAYGLFASLLNGPADHGVGSLSALVPDSDGDRICWQGNYTVHSRAANLKDDAARAAVDRLIAAVVEPIPSKQPPALLNYMPTAGRIDGMTWIIRKHLTTLPEQVLEGVLKGKATDTTMALGLSADTLVAVMGYDAGPGEQPNIVWLVRYPTTQAAQEAFAGYNTWRNGQTPKPLISIEKPAGRFLCGSWTFDQESIIPVVPQILSQLPKS